MISEQELIRQVQGLTVTELRLCVERGWVAPSAGEAGAGYLEIDVARVRLIRELRHDLAIDDEAIPLLLSLMDRVHSLRHELRVLAEAVAELPAPMRDQVAAAVEARLSAANTED
jgi:chaperone modulatory protein CbpM